MWGFRNLGKSVKKSVSFREDVFEQAVNMAEKYHGGNLSAYITYLICAHQHGISQVRQVQDVNTADFEEATEPASSKQEEEYNNDYEKSKFADSYVDSIIDGIDGL
jgi:hypothetical protein